MKDLLILYRFGNLVCADGWMCSSVAKGDRGCIDSEFRRTIRDLMLAGF